MGGPEPSLHRESTDSLIPFTCDPLLTCVCRAMAFCTFIMLLDLLPTGQSNEGKFHYDTILVMDV